MIEFFIIMSELLSPAGSLDAFYAAISNGADAIYLGIEKFNARAYANNFTIEELKELVKFAHLRNVKIYVTMNTILYDEELNEAYKTIDELANIHVDALIIQDLAIFNYLVNHYDSMEAHASTQMGIDDIYGAKLIKRLGGTRVVFARETPLATLKEVHDNVDVEIEAFVHGALCVAYSGNCLMSSMIGERSGNRGRCAGCCRQVYTLIDLNTNNKIETGYLLSMKDLNVSNYLDKLSFIDSFKIEGRMKEPTYVGAVTRFYKDKMLNVNESYLDLNKVFNRTYTKGFMLNEDVKNITNIERPNNYGYEIGRVVKINKQTIWIKLFKELNKGDQIRIESKNVFEEISLPITKLFDANFKEIESTNKLAIISCHKDVTLNAKVYKTKDINFNKLIEETFNEKEYQKLDINFKFSAKIGQNAILIASFNDINVEVKSDFIVDKALKVAVNVTNIKNQLSKLNDTPYRLNELTIDVDKNIFISLKGLNELRRNAISKVDELRLSKEVSFVYPHNLKVQECNLHAPIISVEVSNEEQYEAAKELGIPHIYYKNKVSRNNPHYVDGYNEILFGGLGAIERYKGKDITLVSDYSLNVSNYEDVAILSSLGVSRVTLSQEINKDHINNLVKNYFNKYHTYPNLELIVYGRTKLMQTKYCVLKRLGMCGECKKNKFALKDKFSSFPLLFKNDCSMTILNSKTLNIMDDVNKINGVNFFRLVFTTESKEEAISITKAFISISNNDKEQKTFNSFTQTRGHFIKNAL